MDVDEIFKLPALPKSAVSGKRKAPLPGTPGEGEEEQPASKSVRVDEPGGSNGSSATSARVSNAEDDEDEENAAGQPDFAPNGDADYFTEEDDEGRFFGGGLSGAQKDIMQILDQDQDAEEQHMTLPECRKTLLGLENAINKNREMRERNPDRPDKFVDSEIALDAAIGSILLLTQNPALFFPEIVRLNTLVSLVDLLSHENVDITISVIKVLEEMTDEDVGEANDGQQTEETAEAFDTAFSKFLTNLLSTPILELLLANIGRLNPAEPTEQQGLYHTFSLIENLLSSPQAALTAKNLISTNFLTEQVFKRLPQVPAAGNDADEQNRYYAAELLAVLLSIQEVSKESRDAFMAQDGLDCCLKVLSLYRKKEPRGEEIEFFENVFDAVCAVLDSEEGKKAFREAEGIELMLILMKDKKLARSRSIKVLDFALGSSGEGAVSSHVFVEALGLKTLFSAFMGKSTNKKEKEKEQTQTAEDVEHMLGILSSLFTALPSDSPERFRLLAKFVSDDYEKVDRLLEIHDSSLIRLEKWEANLQLELDEDERLLERLENGLATLQAADYVLAFICMEDDGIRDHAKMLLSRQGRDLAGVAEVLKEFSSNIEGDEGSEGHTKRDIIEHLIAAL